MYENKAPGSGFSLRKVTIWCIVEGESFKTISVAFSINWFYILTQIYRRHLSETIKASAHTVLLLTFPTCAARIISEGVPKGWTRPVMSLSDQPLSGSPEINTMAICWKERVGM